MPVTFSGTVGLFTPPSADVEAANITVLFASPWGLEELCTRKFWRLIAEHLAERGIASLRFDYPATGDALDDMDFSRGLAVWEDSLIAAGQQLKTLSGCNRVAVVSQGLGALVGSRSAEKIEGLDAIAFLAPVVSGRLALRELALWSKVVDENLGLSEEQRNLAAGSIASLAMPAAIVEDIRKVNLMALEQAPAANVLVVGRSDRPSDREFAAQLNKLGAEVTEQAFDGYDRLVGNPSISKLPISVVENLVEWIASLPSGADTRMAPKAIEMVSLQGNGFRETPVRFGKDDRLSGVLCKPISARSGATVLFVTSAYDRHSGWGRSTALMARDLAGSGIASLRFDTANVGDSPSVIGEPDQVLYSPGQNDDVSEAIDFLEARQFQPIIAAGRCSGAYLAFRAALREPRIAGLVLVNPAVFRWRPGRSVDDAVANGSRSLGDYGTRALQGETFRRLLSGNIDLRRAGLNIAKGLGKRALGKLLHLVRGLLPEGREIFGAFRSLKQRSMPVSLIYSDHDLGLDQYDFYFGRDGQGLASFPNVSSVIIENADHNLTPEHARVVYIDALRNMANRFPLAEETRSSEAGKQIAAE